MRIRKIFLTAFVIFALCLPTSAAWGAVNVNINNPGATSGSGWAFSNGEFTVTGDVNFFSTGAETTNRIVVSSGVNVNITLINVSIDVSGVGSDSWWPDAFTVQSDAMVNLTLVGANTLVSEEGGALSLSLGASLTINGNSTASLTAAAGSREAIGRRFSVVAGNNIIIMGGTITARSEGETAIFSEHITIGGNASVTATTPTTGFDGIGIPSSGTITIGDNANVIVSASNSPAIRVAGSGGTITIGGNASVTTLGSSSGIVGGWGGGTTIIIEDNASVTTRDSGTGIGGSGPVGTNTIIIRGDANVTTARIGGGSGGDGGIITIGGRANVTATGIGGGNAGTIGSGPGLPGGFGGIITIEDNANVTITGGNFYSRHHASIGGGAGGASIDGNDGGRGGNGGVITIRDNANVVIAGRLGGGPGGGSSNIDNPGNLGLGGDGGNGGFITIENNANVTLTTNFDGVFASIGGGRGGNGSFPGDEGTDGMLTITGGTITVSNTTNRALGRLITLNLPTSPTAYTYWTNTTSANPGGPGTTVPSGTPFVNNTAHRFVKIDVLGVPPAIFAPATVSLLVGYAATSSGEFSFTGDEPITVAKTSGHASITWNNTTRRLDIAAGLPEGSYPVVLTASNNTGIDATTTFTVNVSYPGTPAITINTQPTGVDLIAGNITGSLSVDAIVTNFATLSYQWFSNTTNSNLGGTPIFGATNGSFPIPTDLTSGVYYYYVVVSATGGAFPVTSSVARVTVNQAFVPVTNITGVPTTATVGVPLTLSGVVEPANATNRNITWSVFNAGTTGATVNGNTFNATVAGTAVVRATIPNGAGGADFTQNFTITVTGTQGNDDGNGDNGGDNSGNGNDDGGHGEGNGNDNDDGQAGGNGNNDGGGQQPDGNNNDNQQPGGNGGNQQSGNGGGGGCNITGSLFALLLALPLVFRRKK